MRVKWPLPTQELLPRIAGALRSDRGCLIRTMPVMSALVHTSVDERCALQTQSPPFSARGQLSMFNSLAKQGTKKQKVPRLIFIPIFEPHHQSNNHLSSFMFTCTRTTLDLELDLYVHLSAQLYCQLFFADIDRVSPSFCFFNSARRPIQNSHVR